MTQTPTPAVAGQHVEAPQAATPQAATTVPPTPPTPAADLSANIEDAVRNAVNSALQNTPGMSRAERDRVMRDQIRAAVDAYKSRTIQSINGAPAVVVRPQFDPSNIIPPQAVEISEAFFATVAIVLIGFPLVRAFARWLDRRGTRATVQATDVTPRLERIEQAIEAVAIEVERVSEGQRFTTRLMSEMRGLPAPNPMDAWPAGAQPEKVAASTGSGTAR